MLKILLILHIAAGTLAFIVAPVALATAKGGKAHRQWGMVYFWAMAFVAASALILALARPTLFLAFVAVFSFYLSFLGYRTLSGKKGEAYALDWIGAIVAFAACLLFVYLALFSPATIQGQSIPGTVFGTVGLLASGRAISSYIFKPADKMFWWYRHMGNMLGSYIAAWSAFSVNVISRYAGNHWWVWLWPSILGVPAIIVWIGYYRRRFERKPGAV